MLRRLEARHRVNRSCPTASRKGDVLNCVRWGHVKGECERLLVGRYELTVDHLGKLHWLRRIIHVFIPSFSTPLLISLGGSSRHSYSSNLRLRDSAAKNA